MKELDGIWHFITDLERFNTLKHIYGVRQVVLRLYQKGYLIRKRVLNPNARGTKKMQNLYSLSDLGIDLLSKLA